MGKMLSGAIYLKMGDHTAVPKNKDGRHFNGRQDRESRFNKILVEKNVQLTVFIGDSDSPDQVQTFSKSKMAAKKRGVAS